MPTSLTDPKLSDCSATDLPLVLVADDSQVNRRLLAAILSKVECRVVEAEDGDQALEIARTQRPDLVLLDIMMPGKDGYEVCATLKRDDTLCEVPIIFLSALSETADKVRGLELGAIDYVTKPFDRGEVMARVNAQLRIRKLTLSLQDANRELRAKQRALDADLAAAADIQASLIPRCTPDLSSLEMGWRFVPCSSVGGDIFNVLHLSNRLLGLHMIDVSGHGVPAAMVTVAVSESLSPHAGIVLERMGSALDNRARGPSEVITRLDEEYPIERFDKYFTMCYLLLDQVTGEVRYCNAAHPRPVVVRRDGTVEFLSEGGTIVGLNGVMPFEEGRLVLVPGDRLYLYTDGLVELNNRDGEEFGDDRLCEFLHAARDPSVQTTCDRVMQVLDEWADGGHPGDDMTLVGLEFLGEDHHRTPPTQ